MDRSNVWPQRELSASNYIVAYVRAFSGAEVDKVPQTNTTILSDAFILSNDSAELPYVPVDTNAFCMNCPGCHQFNDGPVEE